MDKSSPETSFRILYECCPLCGSLDTKQVLEADCTKHPLYQNKLPPSITWMRCGSCGHVHTDGHWTQDALDLIFSTTHDNQRPGHDMELGRMVSAEIVERVHDARRTAPVGRWLDVGFGNGSLLFTAAEYGHEVFGIDLRPESVEAMKAIGFHAECLTIEGLSDREEFFNVISMADCLEHVPFPKVALIAARQMLFMGGALFVSMPNMSAPLWSALDHARSNPYWGEIEHYHNFTRERLYQLLEETGFTPVSYGISKRYRCGMEVIAVAR